MGKIQTFKNCKVFGTLNDDIDKSIIYIPNSLNSKSERHVCKIIFIRDGIKVGKVYCEVLYLDTGYIFIFNKNMIEYNTKYNIKETDIKYASEISDESKTIVLNKYYRDKAGISEGDTLDVKIITPSTFLFKFLYFCKFSANHPQAIVKITFWFAFTSIALGLIGTGERILCLIRFILGVSISIHNWLIQAIDSIRSLGC